MGQEEQGSMVGKCSWCGGRGTIWKGLLDPTLPLPQAKEIVLCPKCHKNAHPQSKKLR